MQCPRSPVALEFGYQKKISDSTEDSEQMADRFRGLVKGDDFQKKPNKNLSYKEALKNLLGGRPRVQQPCRDGVFTREQANKSLSGAS